MQMPASLARRPQYNGMPIPFMSPIDAEGRPLFSIDDEILKMRAINERLCGLCGEPLGQWIGFIGEAANRDARIFQQPGMHVNCIQYAATICPWIANPGYQVRNNAVPSLARRPQCNGMPIPFMSPIDAEGRQILMLNPEAANDPRPERLLIYVTSDYYMVPNGQGLAVRVEPYKKIIWIDRV